MAYNNKGRQFCFFPPWIAQAGRDSLTTTVYRVILMLFPWRSALWCHGIIGGCVHSWHMNVDYRCHCVGSSPMCKCCAADYEQTLLFRTNSKCLWWTQNKLQLPSASKKTSVFIIFLEIFKVAPRHFTLFLYWWNIFCFCYMCSSVWILRAASYSSIYLFSSNNKLVSFNNVIKQNRKLNICLKGLGKIKS